MYKLYPTDNKEKNLLENDDFFGHELLITSQFWVDKSVIQWFTGKCFDTGLQVNGGRINTVP